MDTTPQTLEIDALRARFPDPTIAYFCAEFALSDRFPIYAGGLGILAADILLQAAKEKKPFIGVGLLYQKIVSHQEISKEANITQSIPVDPAAVGLSRLVENGLPCSVSIPLRNRTLCVQAYVFSQDSVSILLLNTDNAQNSPEDRRICDGLYTGDSEHRLKQEMVLGIAGARFLEKIAIPIRLYHLNEGHSALLIFELLRQVLQQNPSLDSETLLQRQIPAVFTNHTLVPAGNDVFEKEMVLSYLHAFALEFPIDPLRLIQEGLIANAALFSPTLLALRKAQSSQAVSILHAQKALDIWPDHPMIPITNGVYQPRWQLQSLQKNPLTAFTDADLWGIHQTAKNDLRAYIKQTTGIEWEEDCLVLAWARRLASYKRPLLFFEDFDRLQALQSDPNHPLTIVMSGKPHVRDAVAQQNLRTLLEYVGRSNGRIVYLQNYSLQVASLILSGADVLVNTPTRGMEACGTSGMKASLNGILQCTTLDGWTDEVDWEDMGWELPDAQTASALNHTLESSIIPLFWDRNADGIPVQWIARMRKTITMATDHYTTARVLQELEEKVYS